MPEKLSIDPALGVSVRPCDTEGGVFWGVGPCSLVHIDRRFRRAYCPRHQGGATSSKAARHLHTRRRENQKSRLLLYCDQLGSNVLVLDSGTPGTLSHFKIAFVRQWDADLETRSQSKHLKLRSVFSPVHCTYYSLTLYVYQKFLDTDVIFRQLGYCLIDYCVKKT